MVAVDKSNFIDWGRRIHALARSISYSGFFSEGVDFDEALRSQK